MRASPDQMKLDLQPQFAPARPGDTWAVGHYFASGKIKPTFFVYHIATGRRALDAAGRRRKFKDEKGAFRAARQLNESGHIRVKQKGFSR